MEPNKDTPSQWFDSTWAFIAGVAVVGPLALPLLWRNPRYSMKVKVWVSAAVIGFTLLLIIFSSVLIVWLMNRLDSNLI